MLNHDKCWKIRSEKVKNLFKVNRIYYYNGKSKEVNINHTVKARNKNIRFGKNIVMRIIYG